MRKCDFCLLFERSWHACWFSAVIVSGRRDLPHNARTFIAAEKPHQSSARLTLYLKIRRPIYKRLFKSNRVLRADQKSVLNQTCRQSVFSPMGACIRIWCIEGAVERPSQMFVYRLSPFLFSLLAIFHPFPRQRACLQAKVYMNMASFSASCQICKLSQ